MSFDEILQQVIDLLKREGRISYRALRIRFELNEDYIAALKDELIEAKQCARDEHDRVLVWTGASPPAAPNQNPPPTPASSTPAVMLDGERRQVTVLFADISGFTALSETMDPEAVRDLMNACFSRLAPVVEKYEGSIDKFIGDEMMVLFGAPVAHENDPERAVRTGLEMMEALTAFNAEKGVKLGLHCGINTGVVVAGGIGTGTRQDYSVMGDAVNVAARLRTAAKDGQILIGAETDRLTQPLFIRTPMNPVQVKGKTGPVASYHVLKLNERPRDTDNRQRGAMAPLVGREDEVALLSQRWEQVKNGAGQIILLNGEAGVGKSRLLQAIRDHVAAEPHIRLECRCSPYHTHSAFYPVADLLEYRMGFSRTDSPEEKLKKMERVLSPYPLDLKKAVSLLSTLLSFPVPVDRYPPLALTPQMERQQLFDVFLSILLTMASKQPVLFIVEDLHWVDPSTIELLTGLVKRGPTAHIYTLFTCRPGFVLPWADSPDLTPITLTRLLPNHVEQVIKGVTGGKTLPAEVVEQIISKTDGVPLFIEELTRMILESGHLKDQGNHYVLTGPLATLAIPATLHNSLMARLDRLGEGKTVAQIGAIIGRQFSYEMLHAVAKMNDTALHNALERLVDAQLLFQQGAHPDTISTFRHAMIQDVAYQSLLKTVRNRYHQRVAHLLIERFPEMAENQPERLAQHFSEGGQASEAVDWWLRAGRRALQKLANAEAIQHFTHALQLLADLPDRPENRHRELAAQMSLGPALSATKGYAAPEVEQAFERARALCCDMGDAPQIFPIQWGLWAFYVVRAAFDQAWETAQTMLRMAQAKNDANLLLEAHFSVGLTHYFQGRPVAALEHLSQVIVLDSPQRDRSFTNQTGQDAGVCGLAYGGLVLWQLGHLDEALQRSREAVALARHIQHPFSLAYALNFAAWLRQMCRDREEAQALSEEEVALSLKQGFFWVTLGSIIQGWAEAEQGKIEAGIAMIDQGLRGFRGAGARLSQTYQLAIWAEALLRAKRAEDGLWRTDEALQCIKKTGERFWEGEIHRLRGLLFLALPSPQPDAAIRSIRKSIEMAQQQKAPMGILRAAVVLAQIATHPDERDEAQRLLAEVLPVFTHTKVDLPDLREARALLAKPA